MRPRLKWFATTAAAVAGAFLPLVARADETAAGPSSFREDPVDFFGTRFLTVVIILGMVAILLSLFRYRGRLTGPLAWSLLIGGALIIPAVSSGLGTVLV